jgi:hypothetical protein
MTDRTHFHDSELHHFAFFTLIADSDESNESDNVKIRRSTRQRRTPSPSLRQPSFALSLSSSALIQVCDCSNVSSAYTCR